MIGNKNEFNTTLTTIFSILTFFIMLLLYGNIRERQTILELNYNNFSVKAKKKLDTARGILKADRNIKDRSHMAYIILALKQGCTTFQQVKSKSDQQECREGIFKYIQKKYDKKVQGIWIIRDLKYLKNKDIVYFKSGWYLK